jgi:hypothetical protein
VSAVCNQLIRILGCLSYAGLPIPPASRYERKWSPYLANKVVRLALIRRRVKVVCASNARLDYVDISQARVRILELGHKVAVLRDRILHPHL